MTENEVSMPGWLRWTLRIVIAAAVVAAPLCWVFWPREPGFRDAVVDTYGIESDGLLFINVPPRPHRYPGTLLMTLEGLYVLYSKTESNDPDLEHGEAAAVSGNYGELRSAEGSLVQSAFKEIAKAQRNVTLTFRIEDGRIVEMEGDKVRAKLQALRDARPEIADEDVASELAKLTVVIRAYEGKLRIGIERTSSMSAEAWADLQKALVETAEAEAKLDLARETQEELELAVDVPFVFAFLAARADQYLASAPFSGLAQPTSVETEEEANRAIEMMMRWDPSTIPELKQALREFGPKATPAIERAIRRTDPVDRNRGIYMLRHVEPPVRITAADPRRLLESAEITDRLWGIRRLAEEGRGSIASIARAADDDAPAVRLMALETLVEMKADAATLRPVVEKTIEDPDESVRAGTLRTIEALPTAVQPKRAKIEEAARTISNPRLKKTTTKTLRRIR